MYKVTAQLQLDNLTTTTSEKTKTNCGEGHHKYSAIFLPRQTVREMVSDSASAGHSSKAVMDSVVVTNASQDLAPLARTDARVFLLYSTHEEAKHILQEVSMRTAA